jgi:hypothetical protein
VVTCIISACVVWSDDDYVDDNILDCDAMWSHRWLSTFQRIILLPSTIKIEVIHSCKTLVSAYKVT